MNRSITSLKIELFKYLQARPMEKINGGELEREAQRLGYKGETGDRRARELAFDGAEARSKDKENRGGYVLSEELRNPHTGVKSIYFWYVPTYYENYHRKMQSDAPSQLSLV